MLRVMVKKKDVRRYCARMLYLFKSDKFRFRILFNELFRINGDVGFNRFKCIETKAYFVLDFRLSSQLASSFRTALPAYQGILSSV